MTRRGVGLFILMSVVWGLPYLLIKVAVRDLTPAMVVGARTAIGALVLLPLALRQGQLRPLLRAWKPLLAYTVAELADPLVAAVGRRAPAAQLAVRPAGRHRAADRGDAGRPDRAPGPLRPAGSGWVWCIGLVGVAALLGLDVGTGDLGAVGMVGLVAVGYATGPLLAARYLGHLSSLALAAVSLAAGRRRLRARWRCGNARPGSRPATVVAAVVLLGLVCTALAFVAFFELIKEMGSTRATVITYVNPAVAVVLGVVLLGEQFTPGTGVGFVLILAGSWLSSAHPRPGQRRPPAAAAERLATASAPRRPQPPRGSRSGGAHGASLGYAGEPARSGPPGSGGSPPVSE